MKKYNTVKNQELTETTKTRLNTVYVMLKHSTTNLPNTPKLKPSSVLTALNNTAQKQNKNNKANQSRTEHSKTKRKKVRTP